MWLCIYIYSRICIAFTQQGDTLIFPATVFAFCMYTCSWNLAVERLRSRYDRWNDFIFRVESTYRGGPPKWMVEIREHPIRIDDLGVPYFWKHPYIHTHTHITHILKDCGATKKFGRVLRVPQLLVFIFSLIGEAALKKNETCTWRSKYMGFFQILWLLAAEYTISLWSTIYFNCSAWTGFNSIKLPGWHRLNMHRLHLCSAKIHTNNETLGPRLFV